MCLGQLGHSNLTSSLAHHSIHRESKSSIHRGAAWIEATTEAVNGPDFSGTQNMPKRGVPMPVCLGTTWLSPC